MTEKTRIGNTKKPFGIAEAYLQYPYKAKDEAEIKYNSRPSHYYIKNSEVTSHKYSTPMREYQSIIECFIDVLYEYLFKGFRVTLPAGLGDLSVLKFKPDRENKFVDWKLTREMFEKTGKWRIYKYDNSHTDGYVVEITWRKNFNKIRGSNMWMFDASYKRKRQLSKLFRNNTFLIHRISDRSVKMKQSKKHVKELRWLLKYRK